MNERIWKKYERKNYIRGYIAYRRNQIIQAIAGHEYWPLPNKEAGERLMSIEKTNEIIAKAINDGKPFWVGRFGGTEMNAVFEFLKHDIYPTYDNRQKATEQLCELSGFFPCDINQCDAFVRMMIGCCGDIDMQAMWGRYMNDYIVKIYQLNTILTRLDYIEPWNMYRVKSNIKPWSYALAGKRVLVIHPFAETIEKQYKECREHIFSNIYPSEDILPQFDLQTIKAVQTLANEKDNRFETWFDALNWMSNETEKKDFDIAIIGCGAYGYPLAARIKQMGKVAIHLAGATQLMFGIMGRRWESEYIYKNFVKTVPNEFWVRPNVNEIIVNNKNVENGCYW